MKAITLHQPWASLIATGVKTIETRRWRTSYRGDLLICAGKKPLSPFLARCAPQYLDFPLGVALCIVELYDVRTLPLDDAAGWRAAACDPYPDAWAWMIRNVRRIEPVPVTGQRMLFDVDLASLPLSGRVHHGPHEQDEQGGAQKPAQQDAQDGQHRPTLPHQTPEPLLF